ncbi:hypothetical protein [uncultured Eudoraea sp.]|uniref:hypothetical protein n=1 Tax=uncultured Eudoraea sp. TaxID=1035614 RepID=UPI00261455FB|nr:hypothetical protein [uncultured Eudoraea sp.]
MKSVLSFLFLIILLSCSNKDLNAKINNAYSILDSSYVEFRAGNNDIAKTLANNALSVGLELENDTLTGDALMSLCRTALRDRDNSALENYSDQLIELATKSNDRTWEMVRAHMNAEMARMNNDLERAAELYDVSLRISDSIGSKGMYAAEHFNKSFVEAARGNIAEAHNLVKRYYQIRKEIDPESEDVYGLIAVSNLLFHKNDLHGAAEVSMAARRLFKEQNIVPDPADEKPLKKVEEDYKTTLLQETQDSLKISSATMTVDSIIRKYLKD